MYNVVQTGNNIIIGNKIMLKDQPIIEQLKNNIKQLVKVEGLQFSIESSHYPEWERPDFIAKISFEDWQIKVAGEILSQKSSAVFKEKLAHLKLFVNRHPDFLPLVVSSYLSPVNRDRCKEAGIYFLDFSGNVFLQHRSLYLERVGFPNRFPEERRGRKPFSDKASLILRAMLKHHRKSWGIRELAQSVNLDAGFVSRMGQELEKRNYVVRVNSKLRLRNSKNILEDWVHQYDHKKNREFRYFYLAKGPDEILEKLQKIDIPEKIQYALGLHAGANLISPYALYNDVHIYISSLDNIDFFVKRLKLKEVRQGANVIFLLPYYKHSVFYDKQKARGLWVVSDIQLYLDLFSYPIRGLEQAEHLYDKRLKKRIEPKGD